MLVEKLWYRDSPLAALSRGLLAPLSWLFGAGVRVRNTLYDRGALSSAAASIPVASVGNLSVGGTGKTPVVAFLVRRLQQAGATPAIVMRGVGDDESRAYEQLAPGVRVVVDADRVRGVETASRGGADVAVLDDAFQHRRIRRDADIVVLSADRADSAALLLPAGPQREPFDSLRRASLAVIVRKAADREQSARLLDRIRQQYPNLPATEVALHPHRIISWTSGEECSIDALRGKRLLAVCAIGDPTAFQRQLSALAERVRLIAYRDHHQFTERDVASIVDCAGDFDMVVCTLKDAVKLGGLWPRQAPELWYVSQRFEVEQGDLHMERMLARLLDLRPVHRQ